MGLGQAQTGLRDHAELVTAIKTPLREAPTFSLMYAIPSINKKPPPPPPPAWGLGQSSCNPGTPSILEPLEFPGHIEFQKPLVSVQSGAVPLVPCVVPLVSCVVPLVPWVVALVPGVVPRVPYVVTLVLVRLVGNCTRRMSLPHGDPPRPKRSLEYAACP